MTQMMKKAWLIRWCCCSQNEDEYLERFGIRERIVDVVSMRESFERVLDTAKEIYSRQMWSFSERIYFSNYVKGEERRSDFFKGLVSTHYQTDLYRDLMKSTQEKGLEDKNTEILNDKWKKIRPYVTVGHNPWLEVKEVSDLSIHKDKNGDEVLEWNCLSADGEVKREKCVCK